MTFTGGKNRIASYNGLSIGRFVYSLTGDAMKKFLIGSAVLILGCATPYQKYGISGGYEDSRLDENTFSISVETNGATKQQTTSNYALYRAAELTVENGFDFFVIVSKGNHSTTGAMTMPGASTSRTTISGYGSTAYARTTTTYGPSVVIPMSYPRVALVIKAYKGEKPANAPETFDARVVMKYLAPQIGVQQTTAP